MKRLWFAVILGILAWVMALVAPDSGPPMVIAMLSALLLGLGAVAVYQATHSHHWRAARPQPRFKLKPSFGASLQLSRGRNPAFWASSLLAFAGLTWAAGITPISGFGDLAAPALVAGILATLFPQLSTSLTEFFKTWLKLDAAKTKTVNLIINTVFMGINGWVLSGYVGGAKALLFWVIGSLISYGIDQGYIKRLEKDAQLVATATRGGP